MHMFIHLIYTYDIYYAMSMGGDKGHKNLKENGEEFMGGFGGKKGKGECN